jgi:hypothetical protein
MIDWKHGASRCGRKSLKLSPASRPTATATPTPAARNAHANPWLLVEVHGCASEWTGSGSQQGKNPFDDDGAHLPSLALAERFGSSFGRAEWADVDGGYARCFLQGGCTSPQSRPSIPSIRHRADKAGTRQTQTLLHTSLHLCVCIFCAGRGTRDMFHVPETGQVKPPSSRDQGDGRKRKEFPETPPPPNQDDHQSPFQPQDATLPKRIQRRFAPKRLYPSAVIGRLLKPGGYSPLSSTSLRGGCEVRCSISSPSADRISRVWYWAVGSLQSVSLQGSL